jgi:3-oxoacyl-[acyl-carrier-protein] synthase II
MTMSETLAITAAAALTPYGLGTEDFVQNFPQAPMSFREEETLGTYFKNACPVSAAFIPDYDTKKMLNTRAINNFDRLTRHLCVATEMLHQSMGFADVEQRRTHVKDERVSLVLGTNGPVQSILAYDLQTVRDPQYVQAGLFPNAVYNVPASYATIRHGIRGSCITLSNGETSVVEAFGIAAKQVHGGRIDLSFVGGAEEMTPAYAVCVKALSLHHNQPLPAISEGAYLFCVESTTKAEARGQTVLAHLLGTASIFCPDLNRGIQKCLDRLESTTGRDLSKVQWICSDAPVDLDLLGLADRNVISLDERLGYLGAMYAAAGVMAVLTTPDIAEGDLALVLCASREGACGALLLEKRRSMARQM